MSALLHNKEIMRKGAHGRYRTLSVLPHFLWSR
jgi:hypothetical protein